MDELGPAAVATRQPRHVFDDLVTIKLDSCHSTWYFRPVRMRFRRLLKDLGVSTGWRPYHGLRFDDALGGFTVLLNQRGTRLIHSWCHRPGQRVCANCAEQRHQDASPDGTRQLVM